MATDGGRHKAEANIDPDIVNIATYIATMNYTVFEMILTK